MKSLVLVLLYASMLMQHALFSQPARYVDPFIGTDFHGHTYPGATMPFGMVQLSPDTRLTGWDGCSGYHYSDSIIYGFSHTHLSGTGVSDYGDILVMPVSGFPGLKNTGYASPFLKPEEHAEAGYYRVFLEKPQVLAELTTTLRTGFHRYTFKSNERPGFIIDLYHRDPVIESWIMAISDTRIAGYRRSDAWARDQHVYFVMDFSHPFNTAQLAEYDQFINTGSGNGNPLRASGRNVKAYVGFPTDGPREILIKTGISFTSLEGAIANLEQELPGWDFDSTRKHAFDTWNEVLGRIRIDESSEARKRTFYTALYHAYIQPNTASDVDGRYRGMDMKIHHGGAYPMHTVFSLWDTFRAWHPLMTILETGKSNAFVNNFLDMFEKGGLLPVWELAANETFCMIGYHAVSVIADAWVKGIRDYDPEHALRAMMHSASQDHFGLKAYREFGHIPGNLEHESISKTLEYAYNDWCIAQFALQLGKHDIYREYIQRAQYYKNIFDPQTGFMRPRINASWITPFDPTRVDWHFTEANSWQYSFFVPQDIKGLIRLHGGYEAFELMIDGLFNTDMPVSGRDMKDITGLIGQYAQGNEPSHHMAYLYNFVDKPYKTQEMVRRIMTELYDDTPAGLPGNEDCGQMSAWYVFSAMGFYPVTPGTDVYVIGAPLFREAHIELENGKIFSILAPENSEQNIYIQSARLNGQMLNRSYLYHNEIMQGGELWFEMGPLPNPLWGTGQGNRPVTKITDHVIVPVPYANREETAFREYVDIVLGSIEEGLEIYYTLDGTEPGKHSLHYQSPIRIDETSRIRAVSWCRERGFSMPVEANYSKVQTDRDIMVISQVHRSYTAGGPEALIDNVRGGDNFRLGGWQGYVRTDFEAVVDLRDTRNISRVGAGFLQEIRSWIWMPEYVEFMISQDGKEFHPLVRIYHEIADNDYDIVVKDLASPVTASARFVKVFAKNYGIIPEWHLGAGGNAFIFVDEIIIE